MSNELPPLYDPTKVVDGTPTLLKRWSDKEPQKCQVWQTPDNEKIYVWFSETPDKAYHVVDTFELRALIVAAVRERFAEDQVYVSTELMSDCLTWVEVPCEDIGPISDISHLAWLRALITYLES